MNSACANYMPEYTAKYIRMHSNNKNLQVANHKTCFPFLYNKCVIMVKYFLLKLKKVKDEQIMFISTAGTHLSQKTITGWMGIGERWLKTKISLSNQATTMDVSDPLY